ncbi:hypothetical protein [Calothrix sp. 336/3]|uniref:hypothetical protein n=1 Tax=Calothrix sp. 336/3 TaxID=1337936 RepID=UPI000B28389C|nr:hypothetical protein [Calothrix sp. 336/3]
MAKAVTFNVRNTSILEILRRQYVETVNIEFIFFKALEFTSVIVRWSSGAGYG